jgi:SAM-dependent methyltransferase
MTFLERFDVEFGPKLGVRHTTFRWIFEYLLQRRSQGHLIVETGCARRKDNWQGDGQSTFQFDQFVNATQGQVFSVDISPEACSVARSMVGERTNVYSEDSVSFLKRIGSQLLASKREIDLLYLDSFDLDYHNSLPSSIHHLKELCAISAALTPGTLIVVDDTYRLLRCIRKGPEEFHPIGEHGVDGKGKLVAEYFSSIGIPVFFEGYQTAWIYR